MTFHHHFHFPSFLVSVGTLLIRVATPNRGKSRKGTFIKEVSRFKIIRPNANEKPIFHCDAKPFALGTGVGLDTQHHNFALPIATCWCLKMLEMSWVR